MFVSNSTSKFKGGQMIVLPTEAFQEYVTHPQVRRLYLTDVGYFPDALTHRRERKEGIDEYIFIYCQKGQGVVDVEGVTYELRQNEGFMIPRQKGHVYASSKENPWSILWVHLKGDDLAFYPVDDCQVITFPNRKNRASNRMMFLFQMLFDALDGNYNLDNFIYISQVLGLIMGEAYKRDKHELLGQNDLLTSVIRFMMAHLDENLRLEQILETFYVSKSHLNVIFNTYTQRSPMDFYLNLKMNEACKLFRSTDLYIYEVAQRLGYKDAYYFSRIFKKIIGVSPKTYKNV